eukprot:TRINITY_DN32846_c0_g1_i1.p1 TRINITY_DN32846_c0_g1~~TRINITY_DN32846_c0_g1_i1.p1  ORF type:complete len:527 (-),score=73.57 TRINITY_DN32846_c0_g1_i1:342-1922(-)
MASLRDVIFRAGKQLDMKDEELEDVLSVLRESKIGDIAQLRRMSEVMWNSCLRLPLGLFLEVQKEPALPYSRSRSLSGELQTQSTSSTLAAEVADIAQWQQMVEKQQSAVNSPCARALQTCRFVCCTYLRHMGLVFADHHWMYKQCALLAKDGASIRHYIRAFSEIWILSGSLLLGVGVALYEVYDPGNDFFDLFPKTKVIIELLVGFGIFATFGMVISFAVLYINSSAVSPENMRSFVIVCSNPIQFCEVTLAISIWCLAVACTIVFHCRLHASVLKLYGCGGKHDEPFEMCDPEEHESESDLAWRLCLPNYIMAVLQFIILVLGIGMLQFESLAVMYGGLMSEHDVVKAYVSKNEVVSSASGIPVTAHLSGNIVAEGCEASRNSVTSQNSGQHTGSTDSFENPDDFWRAHSNTSADRRRPNRMGSFGQPQDTMVATNSANSATSIGSADLENTVRDIILAKMSCKQTTQQRLTEYLQSNSIMQGHSDTAQSFRRGSTNSSEDLGTTDDRVFRTSVQFPSRRCQL